MNMHKADSGGPRNFHRNTFFIIGACVSYFLPGLANTQSSVAIEFGCTIVSKNGTSDGQAIGGDREVDCIVNYTMLTERDIRVSERQRETVMTITTKKRSRRTRKQN